MRNFLRLISFRSFIWGALGAGALLAFWLARDGLSVLEAALLAAYVLGCIALQRRLRTPSVKAVTFDALIAFQRVLHQGRPTLLEFYSDYCAACMANRPLMDRLENDVGHRLQVLRVNIDDAIGRELANLYNITFTPTFLLFNSRGEKEDEFLYAIDRSRVLYWLNQQTT